MSSTATQLREKNKGPCQLCGATVATSWRKLPSTIPQAVGTMACNPCFVYLSKRARDDPETLDEALALCRAAKRPCRSRGNAGSDSELRAARQLPGSNPQLLGVLPTVWLHLPGTDCHPEPVLGLLLSVLLPPQRLPTQLRGPQALLQRRAAGLEPALRLLVCSSQTGELRHWRHWLRQDERPMYTHPRFGVPTWDSEDEWQLLFPDSKSDTIQASLFSGILASIGLAAPEAANRGQQPELAGGGSAPQTAPGPAVQGSPSMQPQAHNHWRRPREEQHLLAPPLPRPTQRPQQQQQQQQVGAVAASPAAPRQVAAQERAPMQSQFAALAAPQHQQQHQHQQQQQHLVFATHLPYAPAQQVAHAASGRHGSMALASAPSLGHWAAEQPRLRPQQPPQMQFPHPNPQPLVPTGPSQPAQPMVQLVPAQPMVQHDSAPLLFVPQPGGGFDSWLGGPLSSAPPQAQQQQAQQALQAQQQAQQAQQTQQVQQAHQDDDLRDLLTDEEVAMLLDDLLDPLLSPSVPPS